MSEKILKYVGSKIRDLRKEKELSQEQLGEKAGFHFSYIGGIERAEKNISLLNLSKIADALDVEIYQLFSYSHKMKMEFTYKEEEIDEILSILLRQEAKDLRKLKTIIKEVLKN